MGKDEIKKTLEDVSIGRIPLESLNALGSEMSSSDLLFAIKMISEKTALADDAGEVTTWMRVFAEILVNFAKHSEESYAGEIASIAADIFRTDLMDTGYAEIARAISAIKSLNPIALSTLFEQHGANLKEDAKIQLLRALSVLSEDKGQYYQDLLNTILSEKSAREEAERTRLDRLLNAKKAIETGKELHNAISLLRKHLEENPSDAEALHLLGVVLMKLGRFGEAEILYLERIGQNPKENSQLLCEFGEIVLRYHGDASKAVGYFEKAILADRTNQSALSLFVDTLRNAKKVDEAIPLLEKLRNEVSGQPIEIAILEHLGRIYQEMNKLEEAEKCWRKVRSVEPRNKGVLQFYEMYYDVTADYQKLFNTLQFMITITEDPQEKIRINRKMARVVEEYLKNPERAIEAYKRILTIDPNDTVAERAIIQLYEKTKKWPALIEFYNERFRRIPPEDIPGRVEILYRILEIYRSPERLPSEENILATYARILEVQPTHKEAIETLASAYEARGRWPDLFKILQKKVAITDSPIEQLKLYKKIVDICITRLPNESLAAPYLEKILEIEPNNLEVLRRLKGIYLRRGDLEKIFSLLIKELDIVSPQEKEPILMQAASIAKDKLGKFEDALRLYEDWYALNPNAREARESLHQLYTKLEKWIDYADFLAREIPCPMPKKRRAELSHKLGEILIDKLENYAEARKVFESLIKEDPHDEVALRRLETIYLAQEDITSLRSLYEGRGDLRGYLQLLIRMESREDDPHRKVLLCLSIAQTCENDFNDPQKAYRYLEKAYSLDKTQIEIGMKLVQVYEASGETERLAATLGELAPMLTDAQERCQAFIKLYKALESLERYSEAFSAAVECVKISLITGNLNATIEDVRRLTTKGDLWNEYAGLLEEVTQMIMDPSARVSLLLELGEIYRDRLNKLENALHVYEQVLDIDIGNSTALKMMEDITLQREDYKGFENVLKRRLDVVQQPSESRDILMKLGSLYEDLLDDYASAAEVYQRALDVAPGDREALSGLHRVYERSERYMEVTDIIRMEIAQSTNLQEVSRLQCELASVLWQHLEDYDEALRILSSVLSNDPENVQALNQVLEMFHRGIAREAAANILVPFYRKNMRYQELLKILTEILNENLRPQAKAAIYMEIADIHEYVINDLNKAFECVAEAVSIQPLPGWIDRLLGMAERLGRFVDATVVIGKWVGIVPNGYEVLSKTLPDVEREVRLSVLLGELYSEKLGKPDLAIKAYEHALLLGGDNITILENLVNLYKLVGDRNAVLATYDRLVSIMDTVDKKLTRLKEKAEYAKENNMINDAIQTLKEIVDLGDGDIKTILELERILEDTSRWDELVVTLEKHASLIADNKERAKILLRIATITLEGLGNREESARVLCRALAEDPTSSAVINSAIWTLEEATEEEYQAFGHPLFLAVEEILRGRPNSEDSLLSIFRIKAKLETDPKDKVHALTEIAGIEYIKGNKEKAFESLANALELIPDDPVLLDRCFEMGKEAQMFSKLAEILERLTTKGLPPKQIEEILLKNASLYRGPLNNKEKAMEIYDELRRISPNSVRVLYEIDSLLVEMGREEERISNLEEIFELTPVIDEKRKIRLMIGEIYNKSGNIDPAISAYEYVLEMRPNDDRLDSLAWQSAQLLLDIFQTYENREKQVELLLLLGRVVTEHEKAREYLIQAGQLLWNIGELERARQVFDELLLENPKDLETRHIAKSLAREMGDNEYLGNLIDGELKITEDTSKKLSLLVELAQAYGEKRFLALSSLAEALKISPNYFPAKEMLKSFFSYDDVANEAAKILLESAEITSDLESMSLALSVLLERETSPIEKGRIAQTLSDTLVLLGRTKEALDVVKHTFLQNPENLNLIDILSNLLLECGEIQALRNIVEQGAEKILESTSRLEARRRAGILLIQAGAMTDAAEILEANVSETMSDILTLTTLVEVYSNLGENDKVAYYLDMLADNITDPQEKVDTLIKCARLAREKDREKAKVYYNRVLEIDPLQESALHELRLLYEEQNDNEGVKSLIRHEIAFREGRATKEDLDRVAVLRRFLAVAEIEDGNEVEAKRYVSDMLASESLSQEDLIVARRVYVEAGTPPDIYYALHDAYERLGDRDGLLEFLRFVASLDLSEPDRIETLLKVIDLAETMGRYEDMVENLAILVSEHPEDEVLRKRFETAGEKAGKLMDVRNTYISLYDSTTGAISYELAKAIGLISKEALHDYQMCAKYLRKALEIQFDENIIKALLEVYEHLGMWQEKASLLEMTSQQLLSNEQRRSYLWEASIIYREKVGDLMACIRVLKIVLESDPEDKEAVLALVNTARQAGNSEALAEGLYLYGKIATTVSDIRSAWLELATLQEEVLGNRTGAIETLTNLINRDPECKDAYEKLSQLYLAESRYSELVDTFQRLAEISTTQAEKITYLKKASAITEAHLNDITGTISLLRKILTLNPKDEYGFRRLSENLRKLGDFESLVALLKEKLAITESSAEHIELNLTLGEIYLTNLHDNVSALMHFKTAANIDPFSQRAKDGLRRMLEDDQVGLESALALEEMYSVSGEYEELCGVLRRQASLISDPLERQELLVKMATIYEERLGHPQIALNILSEALLENPQNSQILEKMEGVAEKISAWDRLYQSLNDMSLKVFDRNAGGMIHLSAAKIADERLHNPTLALSHYEAYLEVKPDDLDVLRALDRIYLEIKDMEKLANVLRKRIAHKEQPLRELRLRLANILNKELSDAEGTLEVCQSLLEEDPSDSDAIQILMGLTENEAVMHKALALLAENMRKTGDDDGLLWVLEKLISIGTVETNIGGLHKEAAEVAKNLGLYDKVLYHLGEALVCLPSDKDILEKLLALAEEKGVKEKAFQYLLSSASSAKWHGVEKDLLLVAMKLSAELPGHEEETERILKRILELDYQCVDVITRLEKLYSVPGREEDLLWLLKHKLSLEMSEKERFETLVKIAEIYLTMGRKEEAVDVLEESLRLQPDSIQILQRISLIYGEMNDATNQVLALERIIEKVSEISEQIAFRIKTAKLYMNPLEDYASAKRHLEYVLDMDPGHMEARTLIEEVYEKLGDWELLLRMKSDEVDFASDPSIRVMAALKASSIAEMLRKFPTAVYLLKKAIEIDPMCEEAMESLANIYSKQEDWSGVVEILRKKALISKPTEKISILSKAAEIALSKMGDKDLAEKLANEIISIDPKNNKALLIYARQMEAKGEMKEALRFYTHLFESVSNDEDKVQALVGMARANISENKKKEAAEQLENALRIQPNNLQIIKMIKEIYSEEKNYQALAKVMEREAELTVSEEEKAELFMKIAEIYLHKLNDAQRYLELIETAYNLKPDDIRILENIVVHYLGSGEQRKAVPYLESLISLLESRKRMKDMAYYSHKLGKIFEGMEALDKAMIYYRKCYEHEANNLDNSLALARLYMGNKEYEKAQRIYQPMILRLESMSNPIKVEVLLSLALISAQIGDKKKARHYAQRVLDIEPENADARGLLNTL